MEDEAETWHACLGHYPLQNVCFLFRSDKNSGCYGNLSFHRLMGKVENDNFYQVIGDI